MGHRACKKLRKALRVVKLPESEFRINTKTGQIRNSYGARAVYQHAKKLDDATQRRLIETLVAAQAKKEAETA
jgi:hypothetical protein